MKKLSLILLFFLIILVQTQNSEKDEINNEKENIEKLNLNNNEDNKSNTDDKKEKEEEIDSSTPDGYYMSDKTFDEKLKKVLEKRNLKPKKKITKDILKKIFMEIYTKENPDYSGMSEEEISKKKESDEKMINQVFENVARSLDYDDKIKVSQIKDWIAPKRTQDGLNEIMDRMYDYL